MPSVSFDPLLPGAAGARAQERSDAARNRELLLSAARQLVGECGVESLTMGQLAERAGVGKGTVFRRFGSRAGLMMALLHDAEAEFQGRFMFGPPPLGPGAPPLERLVVFGAERIRYILTYGELVRAAEASLHNRFDAPPAVLWRRHLEHLLRQAGFDGDPWVMALSLAATLDPEWVLHAVQEQHVPPERLEETWRRLAVGVVRAADRL
ncbi:TetR family transcriptional regulator [Arthrobacter sp. JZ12]|uniref:TetR/AcrR family transcriptional regulator n=1 Tax=Arthrobacter sp. JZ12 TaxID=2654190 RepID=UPI002B46183D|nr:TetR family transcriptional regulator [Arthrobacter sp. JZ12]WRH25849.1 TetR family transcriptional regulator [Arthrobacter sp. JZ12]